MDNNLISIIMPAYHSEKYIPHALESIRSQTYSHWELIVIEDGSSDGTAEIVNGFSQSAGGHKVLFMRNKTNLGPGPTRNIAIRHASGEYLAFLDTDDLWKQNHLEVAVNAIKTFDADVVYSTSLLFSDALPNELEAYGPSPEELHRFPASLYVRNFIAICGVLVKKSSLEKAGSFADYTIGEEWDCWLRMARAGFEFQYLDGIYSMYRRHLASLTTRKIALCENSLKIVKKHYHWQAVPQQTKRKKIAALYQQLSLLNIKSCPQKAMWFALVAWLEEPSNRNRLNILFSAIKKLVTAKP